MNLDFIKKEFPQALFANEADFESSGFTTDSRDVLPGFVYLARKGESQDGFDFIDAAANKGASAVIVPKERVKDAKVNIPVIGLTGDILTELARAWRKFISCPIILVTGSSGKTTTKEILAHILKKELGQGTFSQKSFNNHVGLPQTILNVRKDDKWVVLEAGMNHEGELDFLASIAEPDVSIILNVGRAHIEHFGTLEAIAQAKCEVIPHTKKALVLPAEDENLWKVVKSLKPTLPIYTVGKGQDASLWWEEVKGSVSKFVIKSKDESREVSYSLYGNHNRQNALAAVLAARVSYGETKRFETHLSDVPAVRFKPEQIGEYLLIDDSYNANPDSMAASIQTATEIATSLNVSLGLVLGDMLELGDGAASCHQEIGNLARALGVKRLIAFGNNAPDLVSGAKEIGVCAENYEDAAKKVLMDSEIKVILVKASRRAGLENVVKLIRDKLNALPSSISA